MSVTEQAVPGTVIPSGVLVSPGGGQGPQGITAVSADSGNLAVLGSDNLVSVPTSNVTPVIWSVRLRSFNAIGNGNFEVDQRNVGTVVVSPSAGTYIIDRWSKGGSGTYTVNMRQNVQVSGTGAGLAYVPGTNFRISNSWLQVVLTGQETTMAAGDYVSIRHSVEGPQLRELIGDVHSLSLLVASSVANLQFSVVLRDAGLTRTLPLLCTIPNANTWTLIQLPNLPIWSSGTTWNVAPGSQGYVLDITLACGSTLVAPAAGTWQTGNYQAAPGASNFCAQAVNSVFYVCAVQHEPGSQCSTFMDVPFSQNLDQCNRYFTKSYDYGTKPGTSATNGAVSTFIPANATTTVCGIAFEKRMAKVPTATAYSTDGTINAVADVTSAGNRAVSSVTVGEKAILQSTLTAAAPANNLIRYQYTADTGW